jgi:hypothetical protein
MGVLGLAACTLFAIGFVVQTVVLASTVRDGLQTSNSGEGRKLLDRANEVLPPGARFASNVHGAAYVLYPRPRVKVQFRRRREQVQAELRRRRVQYLVMAMPLPPSLRRESGWIREIDRTKHGVILETTWPTG